MEEQDCNQLSDIESYLVNFNREVTPEDLPSATNATGQTSEYLYRTNTILSNGDDIYGEDAVDKPTKADSGNNHDSLIETQNINHDGERKDVDQPHEVYPTVSVLPTQEGQMQYMLIMSPPQPLDEPGKLEEERDEYKQDNPNVLSVFDFDGQAEGGDAEDDEDDEDEEEENVLKEDDDEEEEEEPPSKKLKSDGNTFKCYYCNYTSTKRCQMARHLKCHSDERPFKCEYCSLAFKSRVALTNHTNTHKGLRPNKCKECDACFTSAGELIRHVRYKHTYEKPHRCKMCNYASVELSKLRRHIRSHTGERPYRCPHCTYASPDTFKLKRHLRVHTGERPYKCDICEMRFTQSNSLKSHRLIHTGERPIFKCELCPSTCTRKTDLRNHVLRIHTSDEPLLCRKCGKNFPDRYTFRIHSRTHDGQKCFKCELCPYSAGVQRHLEHHIMTHTGERPYKCELCYQAFRQKTLLRKHYATFHQDDDVSIANPELTLKQRAKIHVCPHCKRAFANSGCLEKHVVRIHGEEEDDDEDVTMITRSRAARGSRNRNGHLNTSGQDAEDDVEFLKMEALNDGEDGDETPVSPKKQRYVEVTPKSGGKTPLPTQSGTAKKKRGRPRKNASLVVQDSGSDYVPMATVSKTKGVLSAPRRCGRPPRVRRLSYKEDEDEEEAMEDDYDDDDDDDVTYRANNSRLIRRKAKRASEADGGMDMSVNEESNVVMESLSNGGEDSEEREEQEDGNDEDDDKDDYCNIETENIKEED